MRVVRLAALAAVIGGFGMSVEGSEAGAWCEAQWAKESANAGTLEGARDYGGLLRRWQGYQQRCQGTGAYEVRLAIALALTKDFAAARRALEPVRGRPTQYPQLVEFGPLIVDYYEALEDARAVDRVKQIERLFREFTRRHPEFAEALGIYGGILTMLGRHAEAIGPLRASLKSSMAAWGVYRNLTVSYVAMERWREAMDAANEAYNLERGVTGDPRYVCAAAMANAGLGDVKSAETMLRVIAMKRPESRQDPDCRRAAAFVMAKMPNSEE